MPYKDKRVRQKYQKEWVRRKRAGLPTRTTEPLTETERKSRQIICTHKKNKVYNSKRIELKRKYLGDECFFCKYTHRLLSHRKDGEKHKLFNFMGMVQLRAALETGQYVALCFHCHKAVHWCMGKLGMTWEDIVLCFNK